MELVSVCKENMPLLGDRFPEVEVVSTHGAMRLPDDMAGKWFVLFSHPGDLRRSARPSSSPSPRGPKSSGS